MIGSAQIAIISQIRKEESELGQYANAAARMQQFPVLQVVPIIPVVIAAARFPGRMQGGFATDLAKNGAARLGGVEPPRFEDNEKTIDELKARLSKAVGFIKSLDPKAIDAAIGRQITFPLGPNNKGEMRGDDYLNHFVLPNVYFHLTAAYAILRHCGVDIGKQDFLGAIPMKMT